MDVARRSLLSPLALLLLGCGGSTATNVADGGPNSDGSLADAAHADSAPSDAPNLFPDSGDGGGPCSAQNCSGCCDGDTCVTTISADQCGSEGMACVKCQPGDNCKGVCFHPQANCSSSNCQGCCLGTNDCATGTADVACGTGGQQCVHCIPSQGTGQCLPAEGGSGGTCTNQQCGPQSCPSGCCSNGTCLSGQTEAACGQNGAACQTCGSGTFCYAGMGCMPGTPCTSQNCNGCCTVDADGGVCLPGTDDTICGAGGVACADCQNAHEVCVVGVCGIPCSPSTCNGCCDGNVCAVGNQNFVCGTGGAACQNCETQGQTCSAGACH